ncbi:conserved hypothetical protein [Lausannevirus]|uniref:Uncharacterized protein n=1 Tax=Lausannevirus TaxID=999883 RepID=F2WLC5_9VIRU|nr:hypothetical protein LAU_0197 [Lausannevirus]AEA07048.1 conserved hypothetical protein [Lausannevirus]
MSMEKVAKVHRLQEILKERTEKNKRIKEEIEKIREELFRELDEKGTNSLKENGKIIFSRSQCTIKSVDTTRLLKENPDLAIKYQVSKKTWRANWKKSK